ncbi:MAG: hypothetical protein HZC42_08590 [Candidatus Eisenbacteria bacterium]|nr:hypothetical protein [Candidatus Eisenbacteria bacterium]
MAENQDVSRETIFRVLATDADGYYKLVLTVASSFLGGSLVFLEKFLPHPTALSLAFLSVGWASLVTSIGLIANVRLRNLQSGAFALENKITEAQALDLVKARHTEWAARCLIGGMALIVAACATGLWTHMYGGK